MNIGIYVPGLGENYKEESVLKYATRFMYEIDWNHRDAGNVYILKHETMFLGFNSNNKELNKLRTIKVSIIQRGAGKEDTVIYRFYDLPYESLLTDKYINSNIFRKSSLLLLTILRKFPKIFFSLFSKVEASYLSLKKRLQSFYAVLLLMALAIGGVLLIPSFVTVTSQMEALPPWVNGLFQKAISNTFWDEISHCIIAGSLILFSAAPRLNNFILALTAKLVCIHYYLQVGERKQSILGHLDHLLEYICENEGEGATVQLHACDFGALICYDLLFPAGTVPTERVRQRVTGLYTVSFPFEFILSYYPLYFSNRDGCMSNYLQKWYNIYSLPDFFSTNLDAELFRKSINAETSTFGPINLNYDIVERESNIFDFLAFFSLKSYKYYWDDTTDGASCLRLVVRSMIADKLL